jgi:hypothetical protein
VIPSVALFGGAGQTHGIRDARGAAGVSRERARESLSGRSGTLPPRHGGYSLASFAVDVRARLPRSSQRVAHQALVSYPEPRKGVAVELQDQRKSVSVADVQVVRGSGYPVGLGGSLLLMAGILVIPFAIAGYVGLTLLLFLPLLGLRRMFPRIA